MHHSFHLSWLPFWTVHYSWSQSLESAFYEPYPLPLRFVFSKMTKHSDCISISFTSLWSRYRIWTQATLPWPFLSSFPWWLFPYRHTPFWGRSNFCLMSQAHSASLPFLLSNHMHEMVDDRALHLSHYSSSWCSLLAFGSVSSPFLVK